MSTDAFNIIVQKGIEGGFAPPTPDAVYVLAHSPNSDIFTVQIQTRPRGTPRLLPPEARELKIADHAASIARLQELLQDIPTQYPGARDLYGRNTSIIVRGENQSPNALHISGSQAGIGILPPREDQKAMFNEAVKIIESFVA